MPRTPRCDACRRSHRKCVRTPGSMDSNPQRCTQCRRKGVTCVPCERASRRTRGRTQMPSRPLAEDDGNLPLTPTSMNASQSVTNGPFEVRAPEDISMLVDRSARPTWWTETNVTVDRALAILLATLRILEHLKVKVQCFNPEMCTGDSVFEVRSCIEIAIQWINNEFLQLLQEASRMSKEATTVAMLRLLRKASDPACPFTPTRNQSRNQSRFANVDSPGDDPDLWLTILDGLPEECDILASTAFVSTSSSDTTNEHIYLRTSTTNRTRDCQAYREAATQISDVLRATEHVISSVEQAQSTQLVQPRVNLLRTYPPAHIAFMNASPDVATQLWLESSTRDDDVDVLGRTFLHLLVEAADLNTLSRIATHYPGSLKTTKIDLRGLSLLETAVAHGNQDSFSVLLNHKAAIASNHKLLNLAVRSGNSIIVERVLQEQIVLPGFSRYIGTAVELGHLAMVEEVFWRYLRHPAWHPREQIMKLASIADTHGYSELATKLRNITQYTSTPDDAIEDINNAQYRA